METKSGLENLPEKPIEVVFKLAYMTYAFIIVQ